MQAATRAELIERLRQLLQACEEPEQSLCRTMTDLGLYCRGFNAWDDEELKQHFHWFCRSRSEAGRDEIEELADRWQLANQASLGLRVPCDIGLSPGQERLGCRGWARFTDAELAGFVVELEARRA